MSISSTGLYGSATIVNSDLFNDVEDLKEQVTTLSSSYLTTTNEHRIDISQNRLDISSNLSKINDLSNNRIVSIEQDITDISSSKIPAIIDDVFDISSSKIPAVVCTSGCKYWKVNFDPDDKDNTYMTLTQSSKEQFLDECNSIDECLTENEDMVTIIFYYIVKTKIYSMAVARV